MISVRAGARGRARQRGLTLTELLVVIAIVSLLFTLGLATYRRMGAIHALPAAASQVSSIIRAARNFSVAAGVPSKVFVDCEHQRVSAFGFELMANWHFEDLEASDRPLEANSILRGARRDVARVQGEVYAVPGKIGGAVFFHDGGALVADARPRYDAPGGVSLEAWVLFEPGDLRAETLYAVLSRRESYELGVRGDGSLYLSLWGVWGSASGAGISEYQVHTRAGVVKTGRWTHVRGTYDGLDLVLEVDGSAREWFVVGLQNVHPDDWPEPPTRLATTDAYLTMSRPDRFFMGALDEVKLRVAVEPRTFELPGSVQMLGASRALRFDARGGLDPMHHREPVVIVLESMAGRTTPPAESDTGLTAVRLAPAGEPGEAEAGPAQAEDVARPQDDLMRFIREMAARQATQDGEGVEDAQAAPRRMREDSEAQRFIRVDLTGTIRG